MSEIIPRVHGNGFIQLDLSASKRLHIFGDDRIPHQTIATPIHNHAFDFTSRIISGELTNVWLDLVDDPKGIYNVYQAKVRDREDTVLENTGRRVSLIERCRKTLHSSESYSMIAGDFHESIPTRRTVTIMTKENLGPSETKIQPKILVKIGESPDNEFNRYSETSEFLWDIITSSL